MFHKDNRFILLLLSLFFRINVCKHRVAFVFAGNGRSFIHTPVPESIRNNLIAKFCPYSSCIADIFLRLSITDNIHNGLFNSAGIFLSGNQSEKIRVNESVSRLHLHQSNGGFIVVNWIDIGSKTEEEEMLMTFSNKRHRIFRLLLERMD